LTIDDVALSLNDRVLIYEQTNGYENGVYTVTNVGSASTNWVLTRATDADSYAPSDPDSLGQGDAFFVLEGTAGAGELYVMNTEGTITFGTTNITFTQVAATAVYTAGTGLTLTGTEFAAAQDISTSASPSFSGITVGDSHTIGNDVGDNLTLTSSTGENIIYNSAAGTHAFKSNGTSTVTFDSSGNITVTGTVDGRDIATDGSKLDGIETGATADQTKADIDALGINAATLDSLDSTQFIRSDANDTSTGKLTISGSGTIGGSTISNGYLQITDGSNTIGFDGNEIVSSSTLYIRPLSGTLELNNGAATNVTGNLNVSSGVDVTGNITVTGTVDGVDIAALNTSALTTSTTFGGDVSGTYDAIVVANDSHSHAFNNLTSKTSGTGEYSTNNAITSGRGSGGISLTVNDGYGNANITFNHKNGVPEQNGQSGRITLNTDNTVSGNAQMDFELGLGTSGTGINLPPVFSLFDDEVKTWQPLTVTGNITVSGTVDGVDIAGSINQAVTTTSSPTFADVTATSFSGDGSNLTNVAASTVLVNESTDDTNDYNVLFSTTTGAAGVQMSPVTDDGGLTFNPGTNRLVVENLDIGNAIRHRTDTDTYFQFHNNSNQARIVCAGAEVMEWGANYAKLSDNDYLWLGTGADFRIGHNGTNTIMRNYNHAAGDIYIQGEDTSGLNHTMAAFYSSNAAPYAGLWYDGTEVFTTVSGGVNINGNLNAVDNIYVADRIYHEGDTDTYIEFGSDSIGFKASFIEHLTVNSSGASATLFKSTGALRENYSALSGTTPTCNLTAAGAFSLTMTGNTTFTFSNAVSGDSHGFVIELTGNGGTVTWPTSVEWAGGTAPDAPASGETDIYVFWTRDGGTTWYGVLSVDAAA